MAKYLLLNNDRVPTGQVMFSGNETTGFPRMVPDFLSFAAGDVIEMGVYKATSGPAATDFGVTFTFTPIE